MASSPKTVVLRVAFAALTLTACSASTPGNAVPTASGDPETEWITEVRDAGFVPTPPHTYGEMFTASKVYCDRRSALEIAHIAWVALDPDHPAGSMPAPGRDRNLAAAAIGNAVWVWSCNHAEPAP